MEIGAGAGTSYPSAIDTDNKLEYDKESSEKTLARADVINDTAAAVVAIETVLGANPNGNATYIADLLKFFQASYTAFTSGDETPSISSGQLFSVPAAVTITNFDDPPASGTKIIEVVASADGIIIVHDATKIKLSSGVDAVLNTDDVIVFRYDGTKWTERYRLLF